MTDQPAGLRARKRQRTYAAISDAAVSLFLSKGFDAVSVTEIAAAADVSRPTLFRYFRSKEDMALFRFADHEDEAARIVASRPVGTSPLDALLSHFLDGLATRDPITGLSDDPEALAFHALLNDTPALLARLHTYLARSEAALAAALAGLPHTSQEADPPLGARLAAAQIAAVQRTLALANSRRMAQGSEAAECEEEAASAAVHAFGQLRTGLAELR